MSRAASIRRKIVFPLLPLLLCSCGQNQEDDVYHEDHSTYGETAVYDVLSNGDIPIGMWVTPPKAYRDLDAYRKIADCGITMVNGFYYSESTEEEVEEVLGYCDQLNLKYLLNRESIESDVKAYADDPQQSYIDEAMEEIGKYADHASFAGVLFLDEPGAKYFDAIGAFFKRFKELYPNKLAYVNNLPLYALAGTGYSRYEDYVDAFLKKTGSTFFSYDSYPLYDYDASAEGYEFEDPNYYYNLDLIRSMTLKARVPFWTFIQTLHYVNQGEVGRRTPNREEMRWMIFSNLAFGSKGLQYFTYFTPGQDTFGEGLVTRSGAETERYGYAKEANVEIKAFTPALLKSDAIGVMMEDYRRNGYELYEAPLTHFGPIKKVEGSRYLIGCFSDQDTGVKSVLITPTTPRDSIDITLDLYGSVQSVGAVIGGEEQTLTPNDGKLALHIEKGDAVYLRF